LNYTWGREMIYEVAVFDRFVNSFRVSYVIIWVRCNIVVDRFMVNLLKSLDEFRADVTTSTCYEDLHLLRLLL
jgi:hypothetical protein